MVNVKHCQICKSKNLFVAVDLGRQPCSSVLLTRKTLREPEIYYPLKLLICPRCGLGQQSVILDRNILYPKNYSYRTGISQPLREHLRALAEKIVRAFRISPGSLCVDIGSNDGTLLTYFQARGMHAVGVEPTEMAKFARKQNKIETIQDFFSEKVADRIVKKDGSAAVITMTNAFAHIDALDEVMRGINRLLSKNGVFVTESQYLLDVLERNQFDEIYHDHIRIYSLRSLVKLFDGYNMEVFNAERISTREGSIRVYVGWRGEHPINRAVQRLLKLEEKQRLFSPGTWTKFKTRVDEAKKKMLDLAVTVKKKGLHLVADSCPTRGVVLMNYFELNRTLLPYIGQLPKTEKVGKFLPGTHTPIVSNKIILTEQPDYVVILAWHYSDYIIKDWRAKGLRSKFVIPLPKFRVI